MIKKGFTLAEVLITLSIVGVIAAVTLPTFVSSTTKAQIGPKLGKAVAMLEQANKALLDEYNVDTLGASGLVTYSRDNHTAVNHGIGVITSRIEDDYIPALRNHLNIDENGITKDGIRYTFRSGATQLNMSGYVDIDINGLAGPNIDATDIFHFTLWNDGTLIPQGATNWEGGRYIQVETGDDRMHGTINNLDRPGGNRHWETQCPRGAIPPNPAFCAGHIFANNMKVLYK